MKKFISQPYQLAQNKKWIPAGTITELIGNSLSVNITEIEMSENEFETKAEADKFFADYYIQRGFIESK